MRRSIITAAALGLSLGLVGLGYADGDQKVPPAANTQDQTNPPSQQQQQQQMGKDTDEDSEIQNQSGNEVNMQGAIDLDSLKPDEVTQLQQKLSDKGFYSGKVDGHAGPLTRAALHKFQASQHLTVGDKVDMQTASALGVTLGEFQPVRGTSPTGTDQYGGAPDQDQGAIQNQNGKDDPCKTLTSPDQVDCKAGGPR